MVFLHRTLQLRFREGNGQEAEAWLVTYKGRTMASILHDGKDERAKLCYGDKMRPTAEAKIHGAKVERAGRVEREE